LLRVFGVTRQFGQLVAVSLAAILAVSCGGKASDVQQHAETIESLRATAVSVTTAWLAGDVSGIYAMTALERTFELVANERDAVASTPENLTLPAARDALRESEALTRTLGALWEAVGSADAASARRHLSELGPASSG